MAADDMNAVTGIYPPALGQKSNETSGKAIMARDQQSDVSTFVFIDNSKVNTALPTARVNAIDVARYGTKTDTCNLDLVLFKIWQVFPTHERRVDAADCPALAI